jgi:hypothetical protein
LFGVGLFIADLDNGSGTYVIKKPQGIPEAYFIKSLNFHLEPFQPQIHRL